MAKALIVFSDEPDFGVAGDAAVNGYYKLVRAMLRNLGYQVDTFILEESAALYTSLESDDNGYDFAVSIRPYGLSSSSDIVTKFHAGSSVIPVFVIYNTELGADAYYGHGLAGADAVGYKVCTWNGISIPLYTTTRTPSAARGFDRDDYDVLITADSYTTDDIVAARYKSGTSSVYVSAEGAQSGMTLPIMMQHAISRGDMPRPPRRALLCSDIDDYPTALSTAADHEATYAIMEKYKMPVTWGVHADDLSDHSDDVWAWMAARTPDKGGYIYPIEHQGDTYWNDTKANIDTFYRAHIAAMQAKGISTGWDSGGLDSWGYHYFNTNRIADTGMQLLGTNVAYHCSADGSTKQAGYGFRVISATQGNLGGGGGAQGQIWSSFEMPERSIRRNVLYLQRSNQIADTDTGITLAANTSTFAIHLWKDSINHQIGYNTIQNTHGSNYYDGHDSGTAPGNVLLTMIGEIATYCKDVVKLAHPSEHADRYGIGLVPMYPDGE